MARCSSLSAVPMTISVVCGSSPQADADDVHFSPRVFHGVAGVGSVDHDGRTKFAADGAGRRFGRVGGAQHVADFANGLMTFVNDGDAFLRAGLMERDRVAFARRAT